MTILAGSTSPAVALTARKLIHRALRMLKVQDIDEDLSPRYAEVGLEVLNAMLARFEADELRLGFSVVSLDQTMPIPDEAVEPVVSNLAIKLYPEFGGAMTPDLQKMAMDGMTALNRDAFIVNPVDPSDQPISTGRYFYINQL